MLEIQPIICEYLSPHPKLVLQCWGTSYYHKNSKYRATCQDVGVASPGKVCWVFLFICPNRGLKDNLFAVFSSLDPKGEILDVPASFSDIPTFAVLVLL